MKDLRDLRKEKGATLREVGEAIGYSFPTVSEWERGIMQPTAPAIIKLAQYYNVTTDYLLGLDDQPGYLQDFTSIDFATKARTPTEQTLLQSFRKLDKKGMQKVMEYIDDVSIKHSTEITATLDKKSLA
ncbi:MAG: helix-turn-helix domain-containing protein [Firmicutes bacterium]|nr:helix-turn-helix domain-containing protein [Bacillota bacterium]